MIKKYQAWQERAALITPLLLIALALIVFILISGCAEYRAIISTNGAESADATLETAEWTLCKAASGGALERRYNLYSDVDGPKSKSWRGLCYGGQEITD